MLDTFGTTQFLKNAPQWVSYWTGARADSKEPIEAGEELIAFWKRMGLTPDEIAGSKLIIFSDGLDVTIEDWEPHGYDIPEIYRHFDGRVLVGFGWGTNFTNDFRGCHPVVPDAMEPLSIVCKVHAVNGGRP